MRKVLITAGGSGIGKATAAAFLAAGDSVYVCDINRTALNAAAHELPGLKTGLCDVGDAKQIEAMTADAVAQLGGLDVLINNAGIAGPTAPVQHVDPAAWEATLKVNLTGAFLATRAAIPHLIAAGRGVIVFLSSSAGRLGFPDRSPYAASKWGLIGLMKTLAMELGEHNVRANAILPGPVDGERIQRVFQARADATGASVEAVKAESMANRSLKHLIDPRDVAALAVFLASDAAKSISGQVLPIDGDMQRH